MNQGEESGPENDDNGRNKLGGDTTDEEPHYNRRLKRTKSEIEPKSDSSSNQPEIRRSSRLQIRDIFSNSEDEERERSSSPPPSSQLGSSIRSGYESTFRQNPKRHEKRFKKNNFLYDEIDETAQERNLRRSSDRRDEEFVSYAELSSEEEAEVERKERVYSRYNLRRSRRDPLLGELRRKREERRKSSHYNLRPTRPTRNSPNQIPWSVVDQLLQESREAEAVETFTAATQAGTSTSVTTGGRHPEATIIIPKELDVPVFSRIAGMDHYVNRLKEMIVFPLLFPDLFTRLNIVPPRGVLFYGPPGTGKTLMARLLAESCSTPERKVSFFMRNGSDCLSKWIGEAERNLKLLFQKAKECQPSIIFFDELDGLAPERSGKADQSHISLVSTLLALMDGLDDRGNVVVIGATNRIHALDPALRRPGRFDREFYFALPDEQVRLQILQVHTRNWDPKPSDPLLDTLAKASFGFAGADLKALCTEAAFRALRRCCPDAYKDDHERALADLQTAQIRVEPDDFANALAELVPSTRRHAPSDPPTLPPMLESIYGEQVEELSSLIKALFGPALSLGPLGGTQYYMRKNLLCIEINSSLPVRYANRIISCALARLSGIHMVKVDLLKNNETSLYLQLKEIQTLAAANKPVIAVLPNEEILGEDWRRVMQLFSDNEMVLSEPFLLIYLTQGPFEMESEEEAPTHTRETFHLSTGRERAINYIKQFCRDDLRRLVKHPEAAAIEAEAARLGLNLTVPIFDYQSLISFVADTNDSSFDPLLVPSEEQWESLADILISKCMDYLLPSSDIAVIGLERILSVLTRDLDSIYPSRENLQKLFYTKSLNSQ
jgi:AAA+ superfamily predicted ATPase